MRWKRESNSGQESFKTRKIVLIMIISIATILIIGSISGFLYIKSALGPIDKQAKKEIEVEIPINSSIADIGNILEERQVIKDGRVFRFYTKFKKQSNFKAGEYLFTQAMDLDELISSLQKGYSIIGAAHRITIPEGKSIAEIAEIYAGKMPFTKEEFMDKVNDPTYVKELIEKHPDLLTKEILNKDIKVPLEGYLYAATYDYNEKEPKIETIVERMLKSSEKVILPYKKEMKDRGLTVHEAITFASVIEKETGSIDEQEEIAGVFNNRLEKDMKLQTDPTVLYALGKHKAKVYLKDLEVKSPYNTYVVKGLPVGPISNFGRHALEAALNPKKTNYIYFLHDSKGNIHFADTHEKHLQLKQKYID